MNLPGAVQPGHERPLPVPPPPPKFDFSIQAPQRSPVPRAVDQIRFTLKDVSIVGAVALSAEQFRPLYQPLLGHSITLRDIFDVADGIEAAYRNAGYLLVRAYVPPQHVKNGIFTIKVVEGYVADVSVSGGQPAAQAQVRDYLEPPKHERPLRLATIERALLLANDIPGVHATGVLRPAARTPGASELVVTLLQPRVTGGLVVDNRGSKFTGGWDITGRAAVNSLLGNDELSAVVSGSADFRKQVGGQVTYTTLIGDDGLAGSLIGSVGKGEPAGTLGRLEIRTDSWAVGPRLSYPLIRTRNATLQVDGGLTFQDARVKILGVPVSHDQWRVFDIGLTFSSQDFGGGAWNSVLDVAQGLPWFGADTETGRDNFTKLTGLVNYTRPLVDRVSLALSAQGQYAFDPLVQGEQVLFGGNRIGRGYDPGAIAGDHGAGVSAELRYDSQIPEWYILHLQPYAFIDAAKTWFIHAPVVIGQGVGNSNIASAGAGLRFWFPYDIYADVEIARTLDGVPGSDNGKTGTKLLTDLAINF